MHQPHSRSRPGHLQRLREAARPHASLKIPDLPIRHGLYLSAETQLSPVCSFARLFCRLEQSVPSVQLGGNLLGGTHVTHLLATFSDKFILRISIFLLLQVLHAIPRKCFITPLFLPLAPSTGAQAMLIPAPSPTTKPSRGPGAALGSVPTAAAPPGSLFHVLPPAGDSTEINRTPPSVLEKA